MKSFLSFFPSSRSIVDHPSKSIKRSCISIGTLCCSLLFWLQVCRWFLQRKIYLMILKKGKSHFWIFFTDEQIRFTSCFLCASIPDWKACNYTQIYVSLVEIIKFSSVSIEWSNDSKKNDLSTLSTSSFTWSVDFSLVLIMFSTIILLNNNYK